MHVDSSISCETFAKSTVLYSYIYSRVVLGGGGGNFDISKFSKFGVSSLLTK